jgi:DNA-binding beta-propeller fold protein YncE
MQESNAMGVLGALGTLETSDASKRLWRRSARSKSRKGWLLALLAGACGPDEDDPAGAFAAQGLTIGDGQAERIASADAYTLFEADPVRPIAVLEKSGLVAVTNTVDGYLEILRPTRRSAAPCGAVQVGLQPVAVAVVEEGESSAELWVVNHLSDSVSVIALDTKGCRAEVARTVQVGDEPRDIVVARDASGRARVFVATAHRGQNHPQEGARLGTDLILPPGQKAAAGLADVLVFDPALPSAPPAVVNLFGDRPRALAVADGVVYAASFLSGNRTTVIPAETVAVRGLDSLDRVLARSEAGEWIEQEGELLLAPEARGVATIEGGLPAVAGRGRCFADPRDEAGSVGLQRLCVQTDAQNHPERVFVQSPGVVHPTCQCTSGDGTLQPLTSVIVKFFESPSVCGAAFTTFPDGSQGCWLDGDPEGPRTPAAAADRTPLPMAWNGQVKFSLPDRDVFAIRVDDLAVTQSFSGVGTVLFGLAVQPGTGKVFVTNTEAKNLTRFEGHGRSSSSTLIGHLHESRITVVDPAHAADAAAVEPVHLNTHLDYSQCCEKDADENAKSFAFPTAGVFSSDGSRFFFSALGSDKIGSVSAAAVGRGFDQDAARERDDLRDIFLNDNVAAPSGPVGLAIDTRRQRLYVKTHFDNQLVVIDTERERITGRVFLHDVEPESVSQGRSVLYNARLTSSHGDSACASCHVFGDFDGLAWDLGDPDAPTVTNPGPFTGPNLDLADFRSNKGPMTTQTLRGMANHGAMHWRGDRTRRFQDQPGEQPDFGSLDELNSFTEFDVAIQGLNGNDVDLEPEVFRSFGEFALQLTLPPNPIRRLDDTLTPDQSEARALYFGCAQMSDEQFDARTCTGLDGTQVEIAAATASCLCQRNFIVDVLRHVPEVLRFAEGFAALLADADQRSRLEALAADTSQLPEPRRAQVADAAARFSAGNTAWLSAELQPDDSGLVSESLGAALADSGQGLLQVLDASNAHQTPTGASLAALVFDAIAPAATPADTPRDREGLARIFELLAQTAGFSEPVRADEQNRGTSAFRNLLTGCDISEPAECNLRVTDGFLTCNGCHQLDPNGNAELGVERPGFFGTDGNYSVEGESQVFKIPHLRNMYQKTGMFGSASDPFFLPESVLGPRRGGFFAPDTAFTGEQVRGFGFLHDGGVDTMHRFHGANAFRREDGNDDALDPFFPRDSERAACVSRFRQAPSSAFEAAPEPLRPLLGLCVEAGPLPEACFLQATSEECQAALQATGEALTLPDLSRAFAEEVLPLCFQLGSMLEGGSESGVCYPSGLRERAQMESFMLAFDTNLKPAVGQQVTLDADRFDDPSLTLLLAAAEHGDCDLALRQNGKGWVVVQPNAAAPSSSWVRDRRGTRQPLAELSTSAGPVTFTCHPHRLEQAEARRAAFQRSQPAR